MLSRKQPNHDPIFIDNLHDFRLSGQTKEMLISTLDFVTKFLEFGDISDIKGFVFDDVSLLMLYDPDDWFESKTYPFTVNTAILAEQIEQLLDRLPETVWTAVGANSEDSVRGWCLESDDDDTVAFKITPTSFLIGK